MKVAFFLGRIHHAYKLLDVAAELETAGIDINILIADRSYCIDIYLGVSIGIKNSPGFCKT